MDRWSRAYRCSRVVEQLVLNNKAPKDGADQEDDIALQCGEMLDQRLEHDKRPPLSLIIEYCVVRPSIEQNRIVNKAAMHLFMEELNLMHHLQFLRRLVHAPIGVARLCCARYMFCQSGHWLDQFASLIFNELHHGGNCNVI